MNSYYSPFTNSGFTKLFSAQVISLTGTGLTTVALTLLAYDLASANAGKVLGTALAIKMLAYVVFAPVIGGIAHRLPCKPLLISLDLIRALIVLLMPFVHAVWQVYLLIFVLNLCSAGFKPVFAALIPDILVKETDYTKALVYARMASELENLVSPTLAGLALLVFSYGSLFIANSLAFTLSAVLIWVTVLPPARPVDRPGGLWREISFGIVSYIKTPRLRALLVLYLGVASASAMLIVNTVVYIKSYLGGTDTRVALAMAVAGGGSILAAMLLPRLLNLVSDRPLMLAGSVCMALGLLTIGLAPGFIPVLALWFVIGFGLSLVQTPVGRLVNRSSSLADRPAYFSAQFALSHGCWLLAYPLAGQLGAWLGIPVTGVILAAVVLLATLIAALIWPLQDNTVISHSHGSVYHNHKHIHDEHHQHKHEGWEGPEPHGHPHSHLAITHSHPFVIDDHHPHWPGSPASRK
jgi:MFS family permease